MGKTLNILFCPLNWGLGHLTRDIPLINHYTSLGHRVYVACEKTSYDIVQSEIPLAYFIEFKGNTIRYSKKYSN